MTTTESPSLGRLNGSRCTCRPVVPADKTCDLMNFQPEMEQELVDHNNQMLIRPAAVIETDDRPEIHPMNFCKQTATRSNFLQVTFRSIEVRDSVLLRQGNVEFLSQRRHTREGEFPYRINKWLLDE